MKKLRESGGGQNVQMIRKLFGRLRTWFYNLFEPEEVEVTFKVEGNKISYTYTKVEHKQIA